MADLPAFEVKADGPTAHSTRISIDGRPLEYATSFHYSVSADGVNLIAIEMHGQVDLSVTGVAIATFPDGSRLLFRGAEPIPADATADDIACMIAAFAEGA